MSRHYHSLLNVLTSAAFSYAKNSYHQDEADPTPTITGTPGGTFSATPSGLSINTSTGTIDLDNSTIQSYTITYTVSGVSANFSLSVTASPFIANNFSMDFDSASSQYVDSDKALASLGNSYTGELTFSAWVKFDSAGNNGILSVTRFANTTGQIGLVAFTNKVRFFINGYTWYKEATNITTTSSNWYHLAFSVVLGDATNTKIYVNGQEQASGTGVGTIPTSINLDTHNGFDVKTIIGGYFSPVFTHNGKIDEVAIWNAALSSDAVTEIYNATANNTGKVLDLNTDSGNYTSSANLQYWNRLGD
mgnify:CR=1 FL=1|tara:strand:+ start:86 stop:1000 length:915 start_codon:yes stop_codon:yes gene_type:complete